MFAPNAAVVLGVFWFGCLYLMIWMLEWYPGIYLYRLDEYSLSYIVSIKVYFQKATIRVYIYTIFQPGQANISTIYMDVSTPYAPTYSITFHLSIC